MNWLARLTIVNKLSVMLVSVLLVFSLLVGLMLWQTLSDVMKEDLDARGISIATEVAALSSEPIQTGNMLALDELVSMTKNSNSFVEYIFIVDKEQRVMSHTFENGMPKRLVALHADAMGENDENDVASFSSDHGRIEDIRQPIEDGSLGYVRVGVNEKALNLLLADNFLKLAGITFLVGLLGAVFVYKLTRIFTRPLEQLMKRAEAISHGDFVQTPLEVVADDEFGRLTRAMNAMAEHLHLGEVERKQLLAHLLTVQEDERKRIALELHDESGQALTALMLSLRTLSNQAKDDESRAYILAVREETSHVLQRLRNLAVELRPPALDELGLEAAVGNLIKSYASYHALTLQFHCRLQEKPDAVVSLMLYRIIQECLTNIFKHAQASRADVTLTSEAGELQLVIRDDGIGLTRQRRHQARRENHLGVYGMQERIRILGGQIHFSSDFPDWSTVIAIRLALKGQGKEIPSGDKNHDRG